MCVTLCVRIAHEQRQRCMWQDDMKCLLNEEKGAHAQLKKFMNNLIATCGCSAHVHGLVSYFLHMKSHFLKKCVIHFDWRLKVPSIFRKMFERCERKRFKCETHTQSLGLRTHTRRTSTWPWSMITAFACKLNRTNLFMSHPSDQRIESNIKNCSPLICFLRKVRKLCHMKTRFLFLRSIDLRRSYHTFHTILNILIYVEIS